MPSRPKMTASMRRYFFLGPPVHPEFAKRRQREHEQTDGEHRSEATYQCHQKIENVFEHVNLAGTAESESEPLFEFPDAASAEGEFGGCVVVEDEAVFPAGPRGEFTDFVEIDHGAAVDAQEGERGDTRFNFIKGGQPVAGEAFFAGVSYDLAVTEFEINDVIVVDELNAPIAFNCERGRA